MANTLTFRHLRGSQICLNYRENGERVNVKEFGASRKRVWLKKSRKYLQGETMRWREAITGNRNNYSTRSKEKKRRGEKGGSEREEKTKQWCDCALKRLCRGGVCLDVGSTSPGVYVEKVFW